MRYCHRPPGEKEKRKERERDRQIEENVDCNEFS